MRSMFVQMPMQSGPASVMRVEVSGPALTPDRGIGIHTHPFQPRRRYLVPFFTRRDASEYPAIDH